MNIITEDLSFNRTICTSKLQKAIESDIIVPDMKPDILKLLQTDATVVIPNKNIDDGCVNLNGRVNLSMLYIPDAENENIKSICTSLDFSEDIINKEISSLDNVFINAFVERVDCNLINSRKLKVRAIIAVEYEIIRIEPISFAVNVDDCANPQIQRETVSFQNSINICEHPFAIMQKIELPNGQESIGELLKHSVKITDTEYKALNGKVTIKGITNICILYTTPSGNIEFNETELQFTELLECENIFEDSCCDIDFTIADYAIDIEEDSDGDARIINVQIDINASLKAVEDIEIDIICDCYEPHKKAVLNTKKFNIEEIISRPATQNTIRDLIEPTANIPPISKVYDVIAKSHVTSAKISAGKLLCEGHIDAFVLYISESIEAPIHSIKKEIPFSYMLDIQSDYSELTPQIKSEIKHISYNLNAAGEIELRILLSINANIINQRQIELITEVESLVDDTAQNGNITIYFTQKGDTLWKIAKHYHIAAQDIINFNSLKDDCIKEGARLIIPGK